MTKNDIDKSKIVKGQTKYVIKLMKMAKEQGIQDVLSIIDKMLEDELGDRDTLEILKYKIEKKK